MKRPDQRVVITGIGVLSPNGNSLDAFWQNTLDCVSGIGEITRIDMEDSPVKIAGEIKDFDLKRYLPSDHVIKPKRMGLHTQFGIAAAHMAIKDAGLNLDILRRSEPLSVFLGVSTSAIDVIEKNYNVMLKHGYRKLSPYGVSASQPHAVANEIVNTLNVKTYRTTYSSACPAGLESIARGMETIRKKQSRFVICGGVDAPITQITLSGMYLAQLATNFKTAPEKSSRPFDANRECGVLSEGAGLFILESLESALSRGAKPYAEVLAYGNYADDVDTPPGSGLTQSMQYALDEAAMLAGEIEYINAHGPGHPVIDAIETKCIKETFGDRAYKIPISSIKGVIGNPLAASGALQCAASAMALTKGIIPPTANYEVPDPECDLFYTPNFPLQRDIENVMINLHGLGGGNSSLILRKVQTR